MDYLLHLIIILIAAYLAGRAFEMIRMIFSYIFMLIFNLKDGLPLRSYSGPWPLTTRS